MELHCRLSSVLALAAAAVAVAMAHAPGVAALGPYAVTHGTIAHVPGLSMGAPYSAVVVYPTLAVTARRKFPLLSFAHGTTAGGARTYSDYAKVWRVLYTPCRAGEVVDAW